MTIDTRTAARTEASAPEEAPGRDRAKWRQTLSPLNVSALYLLAALLVFFTLRIPDAFWSGTTLKSLMSEQAITA